MKTVHLDWLDNDGHAFKVKTHGLWRFELEEIADALRTVGYVEHNPDLFTVKDPATVKNAPERIRSALESIGYAVEHHGEIPAQAIS